MFTKLHISLLFVCAIVDITTSNTTISNNDGPFRRTNTTGHVLNTTAIPVVFVSNGSHQSSSPSISCGPHLSWCRCSNEAIICRSSSYTWRLKPTDLTKLSPSVHTPSVRELVIADVVMRDLGTEVSDTFPGLQEATVRTSNLRTVDSKAFKGLSTLHRLSLANNHLLSVPSSTFTDLDTLQELDLSENLLSLLPAELFHGLSSLVRLNLTNNRIQRIHSQQFMGPGPLLATNGTITTNGTSTLSSLEYIDLSFNELTFVPPKIFEGLANLRFVDMRRNLLITLNHVTFSQLPLLSAVRVSHNPYDCHCGMQWLADELRSPNAIDTTSNIRRISPFIGDRELIKCAHPTPYADTPLINVAEISRTFNCTAPRAGIVRNYPAMSQPAYQRTRVVFGCSVSGNPMPSVVWRLPLGDVLMDPSLAHYAQGNWSEVSVGLSLKYQIIATNDGVEFHMRAVSEELFELKVSSLRGVSQGQYSCVAMNPYGVMEENVQLELISPVESMYFPSLFTGAAVAGIAVLIGFIGGAISGCIDRCGCCNCCQACRMSGTNLHYLRSDTSMLGDQELQVRLDEVDTPSCTSEREDTAQQAQPSRTLRLKRFFTNNRTFPDNRYPDNSEEEFLTDDDNEESSDVVDEIPRGMGLGTVNEGADDLQEGTDSHQGASASLQQSGQRQLGEDEKLLVESGELLTGLEFQFSELEHSPRRFEATETSTAEASQAPISHKLGGWRTLESLETLRARLKARLEQMDMAKARLKARMERRAERMKMKMERRAERMRTGIDKRREKVRNKMQTIRTYSSQSLQTIRETSSNYAHKLQSGVRNAVENMGNTVQSLKEFCGTGDLGQTISVATIITDVDTEEKVEMVRNVTMV